ncbi:protein YhfH [Bacillus salitolerans]|uniref:Protein YhfH n=1 Tax=Bacillus salitolerans TaxID=1437434 RepID=A0ABW4LVH4_9BACI
MLMSSTEFFKNLPPKQCRECGKVMEEQHECYTSQCEDCRKIGE